MNIYQAARIARSHGFRISDRDIIEEYHYCLEIGSRGRKSAAEYFDAHLGDMAYEYACDSKAAVDFDQRAYG